MQRDNAVHKVYYYAKQLDLIKISRMLFSLSTQLNFKIAHQSFHEYQISLLKNYSLDMNSKKIAICICKALYQ